MADTAFVRLSEAEAEVERIKREIAQGPCREYGHDWQFKGGANAGCSKDCCCSIPVYQCSKCGDCDYGDNSEAAQVNSECEYATPPQETGQ